MESSKCVPLTRHFQHCEEKIQEGKGYKGEDCVEELYVIFTLFMFTILSDTPNGLQL